MRRVLFSISCVVAFVAASVLSVGSGQAQDLTPAQLQQGQTLLATAATDAQTDAANLTAVAAATTALTTAQGNLAAAQMAQTASATQEQADIAAIQAWAQSLTQSTPTAHLVTGPGGFHGGDSHGGDFHGGNSHGGDFHGGDFHGGNDWHGGFNPLPFIAPIVVNVATAPRYVTNPATGQPQLMSPGQWVLVNAGTPQQTYTWQAFQMWPLGSKVTAATASAPAPAARPHPLIQLIKSHPLRHLIFGK